MRKLSNNEIIKKIRDNTFDEADLEAVQGALIARAVEEALRTIPLVVNHITKQAVTMHNKSKKFYDENSDLQDHKGLVSKTVEQIEADNPGIEYDDLLIKARDSVRQKLGTVQKSYRKMTLKNIDRKSVDKTFGDI